jgi:pilus assembly protein CpaF
VIEKPRELALSHSNILRWEAQDPIHGEPPIKTVAQLVVAALRHRPDRIVIGEVREREAAYELLQAMNTGHSGTLSTIHADNALDSLHRLADLALAAHVNLTHAFVQKQVARTINLVVHVERDKNGHRRVTELARVKRGEELVIDHLYHEEQKR